jgi:23S rRNA pseudouridine2605 synthase
MCSSDSNGLTFCANAGSGKKAIAVLASPKLSRNSLRLQKFLAQCGVASRRASEALIAAGRVTVNGRCIMQQGSTVDPATDAVRVDGQLLRPESRVYIVMNKPRDVLCTCHDPRGRRTFRALLPDGGARLYPVGRLDRNSEGLLLVTNDGALAHALTHPRHQVPKTYRVRVDQPLSTVEIRSMRQGILSEGELLSVDRITLMEATSEGALYEIAVCEGHNRHLRRLFEAVGREVKRLQRVAIGTMTLRGLRSGQWRYLEDREVKQLRQEAAAP